VTVRDVPIAEALYLLSSIVLLPAILLLLFALVTGRLAESGDRRSLPLRDPEPDWWDRSAEVEEAEPRDEGGVRRERA
jgi:hypothetical protein